MDNQDDDTIDMDYIRLMHGLFDGPGKGVLILDLDQTIIGDISLICKVYREFMDDLDDFRAYLILSLKLGLLRPGFQKFITEVRKHPVIVVVFTRSINMWAKIVLDCIDDIFKFRFYDYLFPREYCYNTIYEDGIGHQKCINYLLGYLDSKDILYNKNKIVMIDDDILVPETEYLIFVDKYTYIGLPYGYLIYDDRTMRYMVGDIPLNLDNINQDNARVQYYDYLYIYLYDMIRKYTLINIHNLEC